MVSPKFSWGRLVGTPGAVAALERAKQLPAEFMDRHVSGDWGEVEDPEQNELALQKGLRLLSVYKTKEGETIWILTEADRSYTTLMLPEDY